MNVLATILLHVSSAHTHLWRIDIACALALLGIWIEKGIGLIVPGFVPSTLHEIVEYLPNQIEWKISLGVWALGLIVFTLGLKLAVAVFTNEMRVEPSKRNS